MSSLLFHIADANAHGTKFYDATMLNNPHLYPFDPTHNELFNWISKTMNIVYVFGKINNSIDRMIEVFSEAARKKLDTLDVSVQT